MCWLCGIRSAQAVGPAKPVEAPAPRSSAPTRPDEAEAASVDEEETQ